MNNDIYLSLKGWFTAFVESFDTGDTHVHEALIFKKEHTFRVVEEIINLGKALALSGDDLALAKSIALLHDVGRFDQFKKHGEYADHKSFDHGSYGAQIIDSQDILKNLNKSEQERILFCISQHNKVALPLHGDRGDLYFAKLLRDADKLDVYRVVLGFYEGKASYDLATYETLLSKDKPANSCVLVSLRNKKQVSIASVESLTDFNCFKWVGFMISIFYTHVSSLENANTLNHSMRPYRHPQT